MNENIVIKTNSKIYLSLLPHHFQIIYIFAETQPKNFLILYILSALPCWNKLKLMKTCQAGLNIHGDGDPTPSLSGYFYKNLFFSLFGWMWYTVIV